MGLDLEAAHQLVTVAINLAVALVVGAAASAIWLAGKPSAWALDQLVRLRRAALGGVLVAGLANVAALCLQAAAMAEVPLSQAGEALRPVLAASHYGEAWKIGMLALAVAAVLAPRLARAYSGSGLALALAVFLYSRSMVSHAAGDGDFSWAMTVDWLHLVLISLWLGEVLVAGLITLSAPASEAAANRIDRARYVEALSASATFALAGIVVTGLLSAWRNLGSIDHLSGNPYGNALLAKLALVALAAALGGANRWLVMQPLLASLRGKAPAADASARRFTLVLRLEAVLLVGALVMAAVLSATSPPGAALH